MTVIMTMRGAGDGKALEQRAAENPDGMRAIADRAEEHGLIAHRFYGADNGQIMVIDEWPDAESFQRFWESTRSEIEQLAPARVAELHGLRRRADDVGEQDRREHAVDLGLGAGLLVPHAQEELFERSSVGLPVGCGDRMVGAGQLDVPRSRDVLGKMGRSLTDERVLCVAVEHERRHPNRR